MIGIFFSRRRREFLEFTVKHPIDFQEILDPENKENLSLFTQIFVDGSGDIPEPFHVIDVSNGDFSEIFKPFVKKHKISALFTEERFYSAVFYYYNRVHCSLAPTFIPAIEESVTASFANETRLPFCKVNLTKRAELIEKPMKDEALNDIHLNLEQAHGAPLAESQKPTSALASSNSFSAKSPQSPAVPAAIPMQGMVTSFASGPQIIEEEFPQTQNDLYSGQAQGIEKTAVFNAQPMQEEYSQPYSPRQYVSKYPQQFVQRQALQEQYSQRQSIEFQQPQYEQLSQQSYPQETYSQQISPQGYEYKAQKQYFAQNNFGQNAYSQSFGGISQQHFPPQGGLVNGMTALTIQQGIPALQNREPVRSSAGLQVRRRGSNHRRMSAPIYVFSSLTDKAGTTTISFLLAKALASQNADTRILYLDLNIGNPNTISNLLGVHGCTDASIANIATATEIDFSKNIALLTDTVAAGDGSFSMITIGEATFRQKTVLATVDYTQFLDILADNFDTVFVDLGKLQGTLTYQQLIMRSSNAKHLMIADGSTTRSIQNFISITKGIDFGFEIIVNKSVPNAGTVLFSKLLQIAPLAVVGYHNNTMKFITDLVPFEGTALQNELCILGGNL